MAKLAALMLHKTFHVYSRLNPDKKALLIAVGGYFFHQYLLRSEKVAP